VRTVHRLVIRVLVGENLRWGDYCCCGITVRVHVPTESRYSELLNQLMESAVGIVLKPVGKALELG
jgi:hypothetical protein